MKRRNATWGSVQRRVMVIVIFGGALVAGHAVAQTAAWANLATTSGTLVPGSLCTTDGKDLTCDQSVSGLFQPDRITSGTTSLLAVSNTGYIGLTQAGANTAWFDPTRGLVALGVSTTGVISGTGGYFTSGVKTLSIGSPAGTTTISFGNVGNWNITLGGNVYASSILAVGTALNNNYRIATPEMTLVGGVTAGGMNLGAGLPQTMLDVKGAVRIATEISATRNVCDSNRRGAIRFVSSTASFDFCDGVNDWRSLAATAAAGMPPTDRIISGTVGVVVSNTGIINFRTGGVTTGYFDATGLLVVPGISITTASGISSTNGYFGGNVGIGTTQPSATLHVMGSILTSPQANTGTSIDWSKGNTQSTTASCGAFNFTNMQDGGVYTLAVKGTGAGTCSFSQSGLTFRMPPDHGAVSAGTMTLYKFTHSGSDVFVNWTAGY